MTLFPIHVIMFSKGRGENMKNFYIVRKGDYDAYRIVCAEDKEEAAKQIEADEAGKVIIYDEEIYQKYFEDNYLAAD